MRFRTFVRNQILAPSEVKSTSGAPAVGRTRQRSLRRPARVSHRARRYQEITRLLEKVPDVRLNRVKTVRSKLERGEYQIDSDHLVRLILERAEEMRADYRMAA